MAGKRSFWILILLADNETYFVNTGKKADIHKKYIVIKELSPKCFCHIERPDNLMGLKFRLKG